jgi:hypothetical protein
VCMQETSSPEEFWYSDSSSMTEPPDSAHSARTVVGQEDSLAAGLARRAPTGSRAAVQTLRITAAKPPFTAAK